MKPVLRNKLLTSCIWQLTQAWDDGKVRGQTYANAVATLSMYMRKHTASEDVVKSYVTRVIQEDKTCLLD